MFFDDIEIAPKKRATLREPPPIPHTGWTPPASFPNLAGATVIALDTETKDLELTERGPGWARKRGHIVGVSLAAKDKQGNTGKWYFPVRHEVQGEMNLDAANVFGWLKTVLETPVPKVGANLIYDIGWLTEESIFVGGELHDVQFAEALLCEGLVNLDHLAHKYLGLGKTTNLLYDWLKRAYPMTSDKARRSDIYRSPPSLAGAYAEDDALLPILIAEKQAVELAAQELEYVYRLECDLIPLLVRMRMEGISVDLPKAYELHDELGKDITRLYQQINHEFGPLEKSSSGHVGRLLDHLGVDYPRGAGDKPSIEKEWLASLDHPCAQVLLDLREHEKMRSTFVQSYFIDKNIGGKIYPQFHPLKGEANGTMVGRFACVKADTSIVVRGGDKQIQDIVPGDFVWTHKRRWRQVTRRWVKGREPMLTVTFCNGHTLTCTIAHQLLSSDGQWMAVKDIADEYFQNLGFKSVEHFFGTCAISQYRNANNRGDCREVENLTSKCGACNYKEYATSRKASVGGATLFQLEARRLEPHERDEQGEASQLDRSSRGRTRLSNNSEGRSAPVCASGGDGGSFRCDALAFQSRRASYRREPEEQRTGQSCSSNAQGPSGVTLSNGEGLDCVTITQIDFGGDCEVYDITVDEDESYLASGVFSHNSSDPNFQNLPSRTELGQRVRAVVIPDNGHLHWQKSDFSQIHYRILAHNAVGPGADELRAAYNNDLTMDYHDAVYDRVGPLLGWDITDAKLRKKNRKPVKNVNFGLLYGQSEKSLKYKTAAYFGDGFSEDDAKAFFAAYFDAAPYVKPTMQAIGREVQQFGYVRTLLGRRVRFDEWEPAGYGERGQPLPYHAALAEYGPNIRRAYEYRGVNYKFQGSEPDIMKSGMRDCLRSGVFDFTGVPRLTCHDELGFSVIDESPQMNEAYEYITHTMQNAIKLRVPVRLDNGRGPNWAKAD